MDDGGFLARQLGREPHRPWRVAARCSFGYPAVIATAPVTQAGDVFPTLFYLTCPHLVEEVARVESGGAVARWRDRLAHDADLAVAMLAADAEYRVARAAEGGGVDPTPDVGIAGQRDPLATKCLHAHAAAFLGGIGDPLGEAVLSEVRTECSDRRCEELM